MRYVKVMLLAVLVIVSLRTTCYKEPYFDIMPENDNHKPWALIFYVQPRWGNLLNNQKLSFTWTKDEVFEQEEGIIDVIGQIFPASTNDERQYMALYIQYVLNKKAAEYTKFDLREENILCSPLVSQDQGLVTGWYQVGQIFLPNESSMKQTNLDYVMFECIMGRIGPQLTVILTKVSSKLVNKEREEKVLVSLDNVVVKYQDKRKCFDKRAIHFK